MTSEQPTATQVGYSFVSMYYTTLIQDPKSLYKFYKEESQLTHRTGTHDDNEEKNVVSGLNEIRNKIDSIVYEDAKVKLTHVDSQSSLNGSVFVSVEGQISFTSMEPLKRFTQAFLLVAQQPKGYYVNNDVFRFVSTGPIAQNEASWNTSQNLLTASQRKQVDSDNISEADSSNISVTDSTIATIGASSVAGIEDNMSQLLKDVDDSKTNLHEHQNGDDEEEEEHEHHEEEEEEHEPKTYSSWSQVVGGDEYAAPVQSPQPEKKQRPRNKSKSRDGQDNGEGFQKHESFHRKTDSFTRKQPEKPAVYVSKFQQEVSDQDLTDSFNAFGAVTQVVNRTTTVGGGYALVFYNTPEEVEKAIQQKGKIQVKGSNVNVDKHVRKPTAYPYSARGRGGAERGGSDRGRGRGTRGRGEWTGSPRSDRGRGRGGFERGERGRGKTVPTTNNENNTNNTQQ